MERRGRVGASPLSPRRLAPIKVLYGCEPEGKKTLAKEAFICLETQRECKSRQRRAETHKEGTKVQPKENLGSLIFPVFFPGPTNARPG